MQSRFTVYYGASVEKQLEKEYRKIDCDTETCNQNLAIAFNGELIADASAKSIQGGYLLKLVICNELTGEVLKTDAQPCEGCNQFSVINQLKLLGRGGPISSENNSTVQQASNNTSRNNGAINAEQRAILVFDSEPSGAAIAINGKEAGTTPYQGLQHKVGKTVSIELTYPNHETASLSVQLNQAITQLQPIQLKQGLAKETSDMSTEKPNPTKTKVFLDKEI